MRRNWFAGTVGAVALSIGIAWSGDSAAHAVSFSPPPDNAAPRDATGGASRSGVFVPPADNAAPRDTTGGASRGDFFVPPLDSAAPRNATGGASRGDFFMPPPGEGAPRETTGGASRGEEGFETDFDADSETLNTTSGFSRGNAYGATHATAGLASPTMLAVMPDSFYGTTVEARPTVLLYVPQSDAREAVFSLKDEARNTVFEMPVNVPSEGGVMAIEIPESAPELAIDQNYQWYVAIKLDDDLSPSSPFVDGWVKRIEPSADLLESLQKSSAIAEIEALGANGVWYDTAARLAALARDQTDDVMMNHWYELLNSVGLSDIAAEPIVM